MDTAVSNLSSGGNSSSSARWTTMRSTPPRRAKPRRGGTARWLRRLDRAWHCPVDDETNGVGATGDKATSRPYDGHVLWDIN